MKKKILTRPVCVMLSQEMYQQVFKVTDQQEISVSDYIREAIQEKMAGETTIIKQEAEP